MSTAGYAAKHTPYLTVLLRAVKTLNQQLIERDPKPCGERAQLEIEKILSRLFWVNKR
jgi:hypothetical protein